MANRIPRVPVREQDPKVRAHNFDEVCYGYNLEEAQLEASRCLHCRNPRCVPACPVGIKIPEFIAQIVAGDIPAAAAIIAEDSSLPAVCGRVCPQETQCEGSCILGIKGEPVAIGKLERFAADYSAAAVSAERTSPAERMAAASEYGDAAVAEGILSAGVGCAGGPPVSGPRAVRSSEEAGPSEAFAAHSERSDQVPLQGVGRDVPSEATESGTPSKRLSGCCRKVAIVGSGPSGLACAYDLAKKGYDVTIFEALHKAGGVLEYGIPEFRLPKETVLKREIDEVKAAGVRIETDVIVGRTVSIDSLMDDEGFEAVFVGTGAGLPRFMNIPGENLNGVFSANEFLTRNNLMKAYREDYATPIHTGRSVCVVGGGNVAMDAARTALRLGAEVTVVYRRTEIELPARREEVHHAKEEGIRFQMLTNPVEVLGDEKGWVRAIRCIRMELGEPDESGRRSPVPIAGSEFDIPTETVIMALGTSPNPLIANTTKGLEANRRGCLVADEDGRTTRPGIFAGGDAVTGAATVILAMGAGRKAAAAIDQYLKKRNAC